ncbi:MAG: redoxin domain-containing protein, partial [Gammaproteobacteria bacterium]
MTRHRGVQLLLGGVLIGIGLAVAVFRYWPGPARGAYTSEPPVQDFALLDHRGRHHQLYRYRSAGAVVLYTHGVGCPAVRNSLAALKALRDRYSGDGVRFLLINANPQDDRAALAADAERLGIDLPILKDEAQLVAESLGVTRTGEAILIDTRDWQVRYRGPVDDWVERGAQRPRAGRAYLDEAITALLAGEAIATPRVASPGCLIHIAERGPTPSYAAQVAPILGARCAGCHRTGGVAPWAMDSHARIQGWSAMMREAIMTRRMPPWGADDSAGALSPNLALGTDEQRILVHWLAAGAPRGDGPDPFATQPSTAEPEWPLGTPDRIIDLPAQSIPASGLIPYRWIRIDAALDREHWVRAAQLKPSNPAAMHHGFVFVQYPAAAARNQPVWDEGRNGFFAAHVPGFDVLELPPDSGQLIPAGAKLVFQLHYIAQGQAGNDRPRLGLYFHERPPKLEYRVESASNMRIRIPPWTAGHEEHASTVVTEALTLHAFYPHMHYRG